MKEISLLQKILDNKNKREELIKEFQNLIWDDREAHPLLRELAYDLDFYVSSKDVREENPSYFGDEQLEVEISNVIEQL